MSPLKVGDLYASLGIDAREFNQGLTGAGKKMGDAEKAMERVGAASTRMGFTLTATGGALFAAFGLSAKAAIGFEDAFAGVRKTVDATEPEFAAISQGLRDMAKEIPVGASGLAAIAEEAGALGIAKEGIIDFTEVIAELGVTTNLVGEQAASTVARFANITQLPTDQFDEFGSTLVDLGNNLAATEAEIADFGLRIAGAGEIAGLSGSQILGIGAAMSSVGVEAEAGGTAVQKVLLGITEAVTQNTEDLNVFATTAGMSASQFATAWRDDAGAAFTAFVEGLGHAGTDAFRVLDALDLQDQRLIRSFLSLANAGDLLTRSMTIGADAWRENTALQIEAEQRFGTTASQITLLQNHINDLAITVGTKMLPSLNEGIGAAIDVTDALAGIPEPLQDAALNLGAVTTATTLLGGATLLLLPQVAATKRAMTEMGISAGSLPMIFAKAATAIALGVSAVSELRRTLDDFGSSTARINEAMAAFQKTIEGVEDKEIVSAQAIERMRELTAESAAARVETGGLLGALEESAQGFAEGFLIGTDVALGVVEMFTGELVDLSDQLELQQERIAANRDEWRGLIESLKSAGLTFEEIIALGEESGYRLGLTAEQAAALRDQLLATGSSTDEVNRVFSEFYVQIDNGSYVVRQFADELGGLALAQDAVSAQSWGDAIAEQLRILGGATAEGVDLGAAKVTYLMEKFKELPSEMQSTTAATREAWTQVVQALVAGADLSEKALEDLIARLTAFSGGVGEDFWRELLIASDAGISELETILGPEFDALFETDAPENFAEDLEKAMDRAISAIQGALPQMGEAFGDWMTRLNETAESYRLWENNINVILGKLQGHHVSNLQDVINTITSLGPEAAHQLAYYLAEAPEGDIDTILANLAPIVARHVEDARAEAEGRAPDYAKTFANLATSGISGFTAAIQNADVASWVEYIAGQFYAGTDEAYEAGLATAQAYFSALAKAIAIAPPALKGALQDQLNEFGGALQNMYDAGFSGPVRQPPAPPASVTGSGVGGGSAAEPPTPEDIMRDAASAANAIADAIKSSMDAFAKLDDFNAGDVSLDKLNQLADLVREAVVIFGRGINEPTLELAKQAGDWSDSASKVANLIGVGTSNLSDLADFVTIDRSRLDLFADDLRYAVQGLIAVMQNQELPDAAVEWAGDAAKIVGTVSGGADNLSSLSDYGALNRAALVQFADDLAFGAEHLAGVIAAKGVLVSEGGAKWAGYAKAMIDSVGGSVDAFEKLADYGSLNRMAFMTFTDDFAFAAEHFAMVIDRDGARVTEAAAKYAQNAGTMAGTISTSVQAFDALRGYKSVDPDRVRRALGDFTNLAETMADEITKQTDAMSAVNETTTGWAEQASVLFSLVTDAASAYEALNDVRLPDEGRSLLVVLRMVALSDQLGSAINGLGTVKFEEMNDDVAGWAENAQELFGFINDGAEAIDALRSLKLPDAASTTDAIRRIVSLSGDVAKAIAQIPGIGGDAGTDLATSAENAKAAVSLIGDAVKAFEGLTEFEDVPAERLDALMDAVDAAITEFSARSATWNADALGAAGEMATDVSNIVGAIGAAFEAFSQATDLSPRVNAYIDEVVGILGTVMTTFATAVAGFSEEEAAVTAQMSQSAANLVGAMVALGEGSKDMARLGVGAQKKAGEVAKLLLAIIQQFAEGVKGYKEGEALVTSDMATATNELVQAFVAMQGDLGKVKLGPLRTFVMDILAMFEDITKKAQSLESYAGTMTWVEDIADWVKRLGERFGISFPAPKAVKPIEAELDPGAPAEPGLSIDASRELIAALRLLGRDFAGVNIAELTALVEGLGSLVSASTDFTNLAGMKSGTMMTAGTRLSQFIGALAKGLSDVDAQMTPEQRVNFRSIASAFESLSEGLHAILVDLPDIDPRAIEGSLGGLMDALARVAVKAAAIDTDALNRVADSLGQYVLPGPAALPLPPVIPLMLPAPGQGYGPMAGGQGSQVVNNYYTISPQFSITAWDAAGVLRQVPALADAIVAELELEH